MATTLIYNVRLPGEKEAKSWVLVRGEFIEALGKGDWRPHADNEIDGEGALLMPGAIDCHVHFREPGMTHKADIATESRAALSGGVTSFMDMPNCKPATTSAEAWNDKMQRAAATSVINYAFFIGATNDNLPTLQAMDYTRVPGVKLFMGSSTGNMLVDDDSTLASIFNEVNAIVAVHAEDQTIIAANAAAARERYGEGNIPISEHPAIRSTEACYRSTAKAVELARRHHRRLHICHISTAKELQLLIPGNPGEKLITSEVSPHHLLWSDADYATRGARIKMNPAVKSGSDRDALRHALSDGLIDMAATDHAPHLLTEKEGDALTAVSGAPLVQFSLPLMLSLFDEVTVQRAMCENPALVYRIDRRGRIDTGYYADIILVKEVAPYTVTDADAISRCGWTPLTGITLRHRVTLAMVNGGAKAMPLRFGLGN